MPPRGPRVSTTARFPEEHGDVFKARADALGIPLSSWITLALSEHERLAVPDYIRDELRKAEQQRRTRESEQELDMPRSA